jgi:hypothetical protein
VDEIVYYATDREALGRCRVASVAHTEAAHGMNRMALVFAERTR